jgi:hypothetical protein
MVRKIANSFRNSLANDQTMTSSISILIIRMQQNVQKLKINGLKARSERRNNLEKNRRKTRKINFRSLLDTELNEKNKNPLINIFEEFSFLKNINTFQG